MVTLPPGEAAGSRAGRVALGRAFGAVAAIGGLRVADYASTGDRAFLTADPGSATGWSSPRITGELSPPSLGPQITAAMTRTLPAGSRCR